jgi:hypothetical protein
MTLRDRIHETAYASCCVNVPREKSTVWFFSSRPIQLLVLNLSKRQVKSAKVRRRQTKADEVERQEKSQRQVKSSELISCWPAVSHVHRVLVASRLGWRARTCLHLIATNKPTANIRAAPPFSTARLEVAVISPSTTITSSFHLHNTDFILHLHHTLCPNFASTTTVTSIMAKGRQVHAWKPEEIERLSGVPVPDKVRCDRCRKNVIRARFSTKQLTDLRYALKTTGRMAPISCMSCTGQQLVEVECVMCRKTKGLEEFAKSQRNKPDNAVYLAAAARSDSDNPRNASSAPMTGSTRNPSTPSTTRTELSSPQTRPTATSPSTGRQLPRPWALRLCVYFFLGRPTLC